jgi:hypothetical protein
MIMMCRQHSTQHIFKKKKNAKPWERSGMKYKEKINFGDRHSSIKLCTDNTQLHLYRPAPAKIGGKI